MNGSAKSCGKFILIGEHFVVHGNSPAIAFPLKDLWCEVLVELSPVPRYLAKYEGVERGNEDEQMIKNLMGRATRAATDALRISLPAQSLFVQSRTNFPVSRGFGSSAAFSVALSRALLQFRSQIDKSQWELTDPHTELTRTASHIEKIFHGNPSGIDTAVILTEHGIIFDRADYEKAGKADRAHNRSVDFVLVDGGSREYSSQLVERVSAIKNDDQNQWRKFSDRTTQAAKDCIQGLSENTDSARHRLALAIDESQSVLSELGLSTDKINGTIMQAKKLGALSGKVSGAGGGGAVVLLALPGEGQTLAQKLRDSNHKVIAVSEVEKS
mgnify:CR=1 FL=1